MWQSWYEIRRDRWRSAHMQFGMIMYGGGLVWYGPILLVSVGVSWQVAAGASAGAGRPLLVFKSTMSHARVPTSNRKTSLTRAYLTCTRARSLNIGLNQLRPITSRGCVPTTTLRRLVLVLAIPLRLPSPTPRTAAVSAVAPPHSHKPTRPSSTLPHSITPPRKSAALRPIPLGVGLVYNVTRCFAPLCSVVILH